MRVRLSASARDYVRKEAAYLNGDVLVTSIRHGAQRPGPITSDDDID